jgi:hypothetical protein
VIVYELMDEVMDFGFPQTTDSKILQEWVEDSVTVKTTVWPGRLGILDCNTGTMLKQTTIQQTTIVLSRLQYKVQRP